jgi:hypothetical protein
MWWYVMSVIGQFLTSMSGSMIPRGRDRLVPRDYKKVYDPEKAIASS